MKNGLLLISANCFSTHCDLLLGHFIIISDGAQLSWFMFVRLIDSRSNTSITKGFIQRLLFFHTLLSRLVCSYT